MLKLATDAPLGTGKVYRASTCRFSALRKTCVTSVTAMPLLMVTLTSCCRTSNVPPSPPSAISIPAAPARDALSAKTAAKAVAAHAFAYVLPSCLTAASPLALRRD